jgi:hypothetical protein
MSYFLVAIWIHACGIRATGYCAVTEIKARNLELTLCEKQLEHYRELAELQNLNSKYVCVGVNNE